MGCKPTPRGSLPFAPYPTLLFPSTIPISPSHRTNLPAFPSAPLQVGSLKSIKGIWGSAVSSPNKVWGRALAETKFDEF